MSKKMCIVARSHIPEYTGLEDRAVIECNNGWEGHSYAVSVGIVFSGGTKTSYFQKDKNNGDTAIFDKLRKDNYPLQEYTSSFLDKETGELRRGTRLYIPYKIEGHSSFVPTVTNMFIEGCSNVRYNVGIEVVLAAGDGLIRYLTINYSTEGMGSISVFSIANELEEIFTEWFEKEQHGFRKGEFGKTVNFYNFAGEEIEIEVNSVSELLNMVMSIRCIQCDSKLIESNGR